MNAGNMNNKVAKELSDAMARCKQQGVDEQSLRTGLLTITIANFVHRIGMGNTIALFEALPAQIASGIFDRYIDPNTNMPRSAPPAAAPSHPQAQQSGNSVPAAPSMPHQSAIPQANQYNQQPVQSTYPYQHTSMPQSFIPPYSDTVDGQPVGPAPGSDLPPRRRLPE